MPKNTNALAELQKFLGEHKLTMIAAEIEIQGVRHWYRNNIHNSFFDDLGKVVYDSGYGGQELFGTLWFSDGSWADRGEYDGAEWWEHRSFPAIPPVDAINNAVWG